MAKDTANQREQQQAKEAEQEQQPDRRVVGWEDAQDAGYFGSRKARHDDEEYALTSGPDSPSGPNGPE